MTSAHAISEHTAENTTICVVGLGHIGLPIALLLAQDSDVVGVDIDVNRVATLRKRRPPFDEPRLTELLSSASDSFTVRTDIPDPNATDSRGDRQEIDTYLLATPTPFDIATQVANVEYVRTAVESVAEVLAPGDLVVLESTVPPGTTERLVLPILERSDAGPGGFSYAYCPERALPGNTISEMIHNDRVVGGIDTESNVRAAELYGFVEGAVHTTDPTSAEFVKLIENTYRDVNIALANELGKLAEQYGIDGRAAIALANEHPRVDILSPGPGVGGHCIPIDPRFLTQLSTDSRLISLAREVNDTMPVHVLDLVREVVPTRVDCRLTVLGVAYKSGVDDTRESPALRFVRLAENEGYDVRAHDPHVETFDCVLDDLEASVEGSDCLVLLTAHPEFDTLEPDALVSLMRHPNVVDARGVFDQAAWETAGFSVRRLADGSRPRRQ